MPESVAEDVFTLETDALSKIETSSDFESVANTQAASMFLNLFVRVLPLYLILFILITYI